MILPIVIIASLQVWLLFIWNTEDAPLYWLKTKFVRYCPKILEKPLLYCLDCQSFWMSVFSTGILIGYYSNFVMILLVPVFWILTILMYRNAFE